MNKQNTFKNFSMNRAVGRAQSGFTLLEVMVVVAIIAIMAATVGTQLFGNVGKAQASKVKSDIQSISSQLKIYRLNNFNYPTTDQGLEALVNKPSSDPEPQNWQKLLDKMPKDPWGREYLYVSPGEKGDYDLYSLGRDGRVGGEGEDADIGNWE